MANQDQPRGLEPKGSPLRKNKYVSGSAVYPGDAVKLDSSGRVAVAAASDALCGVAASYASAAGEDVWVWDHQDQLFCVQADDADIDAQTDIGLNYDILATAGSSAFKISRMELDSSSGATTATLPLKLLAIEARPNNALGAQVDCIVKINNHQLSGGTGSAGV
jgi:hypothetical protein